MPAWQNNFNLSAFLADLKHAFVGLVCHIGFDAAWHGALFAFFILLAGLALKSRQLRFGKPLLQVSLKLGIFCLVLALPGLIWLITRGSLPATGNLHVSSLGFIAFWSLICLHLSAEEMNYQWF